MNNSVQKHDSSGNSIVEKVLFYSRASKACDMCLMFASINDLNISSVCIDHPEIRKTVTTKGSYFNISHVPTLLLTLNDGRLQILQGPKVLAWMKQQIAPPPSTNTYNPSHQPTQHSPAFVKTQPPIQGQSSPKTGLSQEYPSDSQSPIDQSPIDQSPIDQSPIDQSSEFLNPVEELASEVSGIQFSNNPAIQQQPPRGDTRMNDVKDIAKRMQMEREQSLGYNESELPYH